MQYTFLGFSQEKLIELDLDDRDAALLDFFVRFKDSGSMYSEQVDGEIYYWIKYEYIRKELPLLGNKLKKDSLYRRFKKMADKGVLKHYCKKTGGTYSFYTLGDKYYSLLSSSLKRQPSQPELPLPSAGAKPPVAEEVSGPSGNKSEGVGDKSVPSGNISVPSGLKSEGVGSKSVPSDFTSEPGTEENPKGYGNTSVPKDQSTKDQSTKEIREREQSSPALACYVEKFPDVKLSKRRKQDIITIVTSLDAWKYTCWWWEIKEYRPQNTENMLDYYTNKAVPKLAEVQTRKPEPATQPTGDTTPSNSPLSEWARVSAILEQRIHRPSFNTWIRPIEGEPMGNNGQGNDGQTVKVYVPDPVFQYWLGEYYVTVIQDAYQTIHGRRPEIEFVVKED